MIQVARDGLTQLHPHAETQGSPPTVDIIFVHGLRGHPRTTWEGNLPQPGPAKAPATSEPASRLPKKRFRLPFSKRNKEPESNIIGSSSADSSTTSLAQTVFWPADQAPSKLPGARIWTYGYNANVVGGIFESNNKNSIRQHGNDLMVKMERSVRGNAPIFFVAHSLGGIVVKSAINRMRASCDSRFEACYDRIGGVIFCGSPHRGSGAASWGVLASRMVTMAFMDSNNKLLSELRIDSEALDIIQEDFLKILSLSPNTIRIHSFQEGRALSGVKGFHEKVVPDLSSKLGWPSETFETIDADHREMIRGAGVRDILDVLKDMETEAVDKRKQRERVAQSLSNNDAGNTNNPMPYVYLHLFHKIHRDEMRLRVSRPQPGTCSWLMERQAIKNWISDNGSNLIWLCGHPGFGKSVLARYLVDKLSEETDSFMTIFFFCSYLDDRTQKLTTLLSALIYQLVFEDPSLSEPISRKYGVIDGKIADSNADLWEILALVISAPRRRTIFLVIDALDELARESWHEMEKLISHVRESKGSVKLLITSRHEPEIGQVLGGLPVRLDLGKIADNRSDVETYLQHTVKTYGRSRSFGEDRIKIVVDEMISRADGMFLWAKLAWTDFIDGVGLWTKSTLDRKITELRQLPPGLDALYHRILTKIDKSYWHDIIHILSWIAVAPRPFTIGELPTALALKERPRKLGDMELGFNVPQFLGSCLPNLIEVHQNGDVTPVHQSFKDFLTETTEVFETKVQNPFFINKYDANYEAGLSCLCYLGLEDYNSDENLRSKLLPALEHMWFRLDTVEILPRYPFIKYAMEHWASHLAESNKRLNQKESRSLTMDLHDCRDGNEVVWNYFEKTLFHDDGSGDELATLLDRRIRWAPEKPAIFTLYLSKLWGLLKQASLHGFDMNESGSRNFLPEHERTVFFSWDQDTLVHMAFDGDDLEAISCLVSLGADVNARGWNGRSLLHLLVNRQIPKDIATWLAYPGVNVNAQDDKGDTPLHSATRNDRHTEEILDILLATPSIDISIKNYRGQDALTVAAHWGKFKAARRLLEVPGITLNHSTLPNQTESALINAAIQGWSEVVIHILNILPSIDQFQDWSNRTILHWTVIRSLHGAFDIALDKQTHILNQPDIKGMTPLHYATDYGMVSMVETLLQHGASTSERNKFGETPLHLACGHGDMPIVKLLLNQMPEEFVNKRDFSGWTAMHRALTSGDDDLAEWFSSQTVVSVHVCDHHGRLPIHFAAAYASRTMLQSFSRRFPSQVWATDAFGYTLLHMAVVGSNRPNVSYLLNHFPAMDPNAQNKWGKQPLDYARHESIKDMLLENGFRHSATHVRQLNRLYAHLVRSGSDRRIQHPERELVKYEEPKANEEEGQDEKGQTQKAEEGKEEKD